MLSSNTETVKCQPLQQLSTKFPYFRMLLSPDDRHHAVQSLTQIFTEVVQIRRTSGQVRVQNLCKQIED